jgi:hypothetical protein
VPAAIVNVFQLPGYNTVPAVDGVRQMMAQLKRIISGWRGLRGITLAVGEGIKGSSHFFDVEIQQLLKSVIARAKEAQAYRAVARSAYLPTVNADSGV